MRSQLRKQMGGPTSTPPIVALLDGLLVLRAVHFRLRDGLLGVHAIDVAVVLLLVCGRRAVLYVRTSGQIRFYW